MSSVSGSSDTDKNGDQLIQRICQPQIGLVKHFGFDVQLNSGEWVSGIKEADLRTFPKFNLACAMQGVTCCDPWYYGTFSALKRATWCRMIARAIQRGQQKQEASA